jgi:hypothetical protein
LRSSFEGGFWARQPDLPAHWCLQSSRVCDVLALAWNSCAGWLLGLGTSRAKRLGFGASQLTVAVLALCSHHGGLGLCCVASAPYIGLELWEDLGRCLMLWATQQGAATEYAMSTLLPGSASVAGWQHALHRRTLRWRRRHAGFQNLSCNNLCLLLL